MVRKRFFGIISGTKSPRTKIFALFGSSYMTGPWANIKFFGVLGAFVDFKKRMILMGFPRSQAKSARRGPSEGWVCKGLGLIQASEFRVLLIYVYDQKSTYPGQSKTFSSTQLDHEVGIASKLESAKVINGQRLIK